MLIVRLGSGHVWEIWRKCFKNGWMTRSRTREYSTLHSPILELLQFLVEAADWRDFLGCGFCFPIVFISSSCSFHRLYRKVGNSSSFFDRSTALKKKRPSIVIGYTLWRNIYLLWRRLSNCWTLKAQTWRKLCRSYNAPLKCQIRFIFNLHLHTSELWLSPSWL